MTFIDFFAGIGGFRRGMELAGHTCVGFCEFDKFATASYTSMHLITDERREYLATLDKKKRQKEILKDEYRNGEWYASDIRTVRAVDIPSADCWCFGAPCQDFSVAGTRAGLEGERSSLIREIFRLLEETREEDRPEWLLYENVKGMLSSNRGFDFLAILLEMDRGGYDIEWQLLDSQYYGVPQHRERVYTVGHLRSKGERKIFPITGTNGENHLEIKQVGRYAVDRNNSNAYRIYDPIDSLSPSLNTMAGGGREPMIIKYVCEYPFGGERKGIIDPTGVSRTLSATEYKQPTSIVLNALTPQKRIKNQEDEQGGIYVQIDDSHVIYALWQERYNGYIAIRKITPKECFRLQGWGDNYFKKAEMVNSDTQLYKQAGNGVTVNVVYDIAKEMEVEENGKEERDDL